AFAGRGFDDLPAVRDLQLACLRGLAWLAGGCGRRREGLDVLYGTGKAGPRMLAKGLRKGVAATDDDGLGLAQRQQGL
ncbi:UNVERIFIED_CONTAM: hypothetical protein IGO34_36965, partial [Salmonella enterica subsp. enterica serovar Weltevreden]